MSHLYKCDNRHCHKVIHDSEVFLIKIVSPVGSMGTERHLCEKCLDKHWKPIEI